MDRNRIKEKLGAKIRRHAWGVTSAQRREVAAKVLELAEGGNWIFHRQDKRQRQIYGYDTIVIASVFLSEKTIFVCFETKSKQFTIRVRENGSIQSVANSPIVWRF